MSLVGTWSSAVPVLTPTPSIFVGRFGGGRELEGEWSEVLKTQRHVQHVPVFPAVSWQLSRNQPSPVQLAKPSDLLYALPRSVINRKSQSIWKEIYSQRTLRYSLEIVIGVCVWPCGNPLNK